MENLEEETQIVILERLLEEMKSVEEFASTTWNASWWEQCSDAYSKELAKDKGPYSLSKLEQKYQGYYTLSNVYNQNLIIGEPLRKEILIDEDGKKYECEFRRIDWNNMNSNKSKRFFSFKSNGDIYFSKENKKKLTLQHPKNTSYEANYNVLSDNFMIKISISQLTQTSDWRNCNVEKHDYITISLNENFLIERLNDIEIIYNLNTGMKSVKIVKEYDKRNRKNNTSSDFEVTLNSDDTLIKGAAVINTHKGNGKINGTYRFDVSRNKGVRANFYSRTGVKVNLIENLNLLQTPNQLLLTESGDKNSSAIDLDFTDSSQKATLKNLSQKEITFDSSDFNMEKIRQAEQNVVEKLKSIKGELPLTGLVERVNNYLNLIDKKQKTLKITMQKK